MGNTCGSADSVSESRCYRSRESPVHVKDAAGAQTARTEHLAYCLMWVIIGSLAVHAGAPEDGGVHDPDEVMFFEHAGDFLIPAGLIRLLGARLGGGGPVQH